MTMPNPNTGMKDEAQKGIDWREEFGRGGTRVGAVRARQIVNGENLSDDTVKRMYSFFSRHEVDKQAEGFSSGEDGYPSNGRIAWALWGGDAGFSWSKRLVEQMKKEDDRAMPDALKVGDFVSWNSSGGRARGKIIKIERDGKIDVPNTDFSITGTEDDPAALIQVYRSGEPTDVEVGHKFSTLTKINPIRDFNDFNSNELEKHPLLKGKEEKTMNKEDRHILNVTETDETVVVEFAKHEDVEHEGEEVEMTEEVSMIDEEDKERNVIDMPIKYRTIDLSKHSYLDEENRTVKIGVSSEEPVERSFGMEVLGHSEGDINMEFIASGRAPLLLDHDMTKQIGVIEEFKLDETAKRTTAVVRFGKSELAREVYEDVKDGIRMNISVGYRVDKLSRMDKDDETYYKAQWTPMEVSSVSVPADQSRLVGVGRSKDKQTLNTKVKIMENEKQEINLDEVRTQSVDEARKEFQKNSKEIIDLGARHNKRDLANQAIKDGASVEEFRGVLLENISNNTPLETPSEIGMTEKEVREFSLVRAINALANPTDRRAQEAAAFEFECSNEAARQQGKSAQGIMMPSDMLRSWVKRDLNTSDDAALVAQDYRGGDFIDVLRNKSSVMQAGATMLRGLQGNVVIPKKTAASAAAWIATEGGNSGESEFTVGSVTMSPKVIGGHTEMTRLMLQQSSLDVENLVRNDLSEAIATAIDLGALAGSGSSGQPTGVSATSGINTTTFAAAVPTFAELVAMESAVSADNALQGNLRYIAKPSDWGNLKTVDKASNFGQMIVGNDGQINGYDVIRSNQVTAGDYYFGNFADLLIGLYGSLDITVDPYTHSKSGTIRVVALQTCDVAVRHAVSFCKSSD